MIFWISKLIASWFGLDISVVQKRVLLAFMILAGIIVIVIGLRIKSCVVPSPKIDIKNVDKINRANETERKKELETLIVNNQSTVKTVDGRNAIAELNEAEKQAAIFAKIREADEKIARAKAEGRDITGPELECLLAKVCE